MIYHVTGKPHNNAMQQTVRAARPLLSWLRPTSPRKVASKGRATRPAADRGRYPVLALPSPVLDRESPG